MKIKLFESFEDSKLVFSVKACFQDLIEDNILDIEYEEYEGVESVYLMGTINTALKSNNFNTFYKSIKEEFDLLTTIKKCISKLEQFHEKDLQVDFEVNSFSDADVEFSFTIIEGKTDKGDFWRVNPYGEIKLDESELIKILGLPKSVDIGMSTTGSDWFIKFRFLNETDLDKYKDDLIKKALELKINNKPMIGDAKWTWSSSTGDEIAKYKVFKNKTESYYSRGAGGGRKKSTEIINSVDFGLNKDLKFSW